MHKRGDPKPSGHIWRRQTLTQLQKLRRNARLWCEDCGHEIERSPVYMAMFFDLPYETRLYELAQRLQCSKCGSHRVGIAVVG